MRFSYYCPAGGSASSLWGTGEYTSDSSICTAAVHAGRIAFATGGAITIELRAGRASYTGSARNGVTSSSYGSYGCSFAAVAPACAAAFSECGDVCTDVTGDPMHCGACTTVCTAPLTSCVASACACPTGRTSCGGACVDTLTDTAHCGGCSMPCAAGESCAAGVCGATAATWSTNATAYSCATAGVIGSRHTYACPPGGSAGSIWGTDTYTHDSSVCTAGVHVGRITLAGGGLVTIEMAAGLASYAASTRNGITSGTWGTWSCSFTIP